MATKLHITEIEGRNEVEMDCPPLPPTRMRHRGDKIDPKGRVSALCFPTPRAIDMKRATWVMSDDAVTCPKCRALILARLKTPNAQGEPITQQT